MKDNKVSNIDKNMFILSTYQNKEYKKIYDDLSNELDIFANFIQDEKQKLQYLKDISNLKNKLDIMYNNYLNNKNELIQVLNDVVEFDKLFNTKINTLNELETNLLYKHSVRLIYGGDSINESDK